MQRKALQALDRTVSGVTRFHSPDAQKAVISLTHTGLISDVFETAGGAIACRITPPPAAPPYRRRPMHADRPIVRTKADLDQLSGQDEIVEGYLDGFNGSEMPGNNRSDGYFHGWKNGRNDRDGKAEADQLALAKDIIDRRRGAKSDAR